MQVPWTHVECAHNRRKRYPPVLTWRLSSANQLHWLSPVQAECMRSVSERSIWLVCSGDGPIATDEGPWGIFHCLPRWGGGAVSGPWSCYTRGVFFFSGEGGSWRNPKPGVIVLWCIILRLLLLLSLKFLCNILLYMGIESGGNGGTRLPIKISEGKSPSKTHMKISHYDYF